MSYVGIFRFCGGGNFSFIAMPAVKSFWHGGKNVSIASRDIILYNKTNIETATGIENAAFPYIFYKYQ